MRIKDKTSLPKNIRDQIKVIKTSVKRRSIGGIRADLGQYFRSRMEANFARYLNWLIDQNEIAKWEYEADTFKFHGIKRGSIYYTPDFKVWEDIGVEPYYIEIKGWMDPKSKTKLKRMSKYYPNVKITLVDSKYYRSLAKDMSTLIPNWE